MDWAAIGADLELIGRRENAVEFCDEFLIAAEELPYLTVTSQKYDSGDYVASLEAAANPAATDYFFYVVKPGTCGEHEFVETQAEFDAAVAKYNSAREAAGGKSPTECD